MYVNRYSEMLLLIIGLPGEFGWEAEESEQRGVEKGRHVGNEQTWCAIIQVDNLDSESPKGTAGASSVIDGKRRASIGHCGSKVPPAHRRPLLFLLAQLCYNCDGFNSNN